MKKLSDRQQLFCKYVAEGDNPSFAAVKARYSEKGNRSRACRLMKKDEIRAEIRRLQEEIATPRIVSVLERKKRLSEIARATMADYFETVNGRLQWKEGADKARAHSIFKIKTKTKTDKSGNIISQMMSVWRQRSKSEQNAVLFLSSSGVSIIPPWLLINHPVMTPL